MCTYSSTYTTFYNCFPPFYIGLRKPRVWQQHWGTPAIPSERELHHSQFKHKSGFGPQNQTVCQEELRHRSGRGKDRGHRLHYKGHAHDISARWVALKRGGVVFFSIYFKKHIYIVFRRPRAHMSSGFLSGSWSMHERTRLPTVKIWEILRSIERIIKSIRLLRVTIQQLYKMSYTKV